MVRPLPARRFRFIRIFMRYIPSQQRRRVLLHVNLFLKLSAIQLHVFMRVPRVAILAGKLASSIRVDRPFEWHAVRIAPVQDRLHRQHKIFWLFRGLPPCLCWRGKCCEAGYADQSRVSAFRGCHGIISDRTRFAVLVSALGPGRRGAICRHWIGNAAALVLYPGRTLDHLLWAFGLRALRKESCCGW